MNTSPKFWDKIANRYAKSPVKDEAAYQRKLEVTREYFTPDAVVFEFGCGTGSTALAHAPFVKHILATDISPRMIEIAKQKANAADITNVTFAVSAIEDAARGEETYDVVMGHSILHLVEDRNAAIAQAHNLLKPGGAFVSSTACLGGRMRWLKLIAPIGRFLGLMPIVSFFTEKELTESITSAGFVVEHQWTPPKGIAVFIVARKV